MLKRIISSAIILTTTGLFAAISTFAYAVGDVDNSGKVDVEDAVNVINHINGVSALNDEAFDAADVDMNGNVDVEDVVTIINSINGVAPLKSKPYNIGDTWTVDGQWKLTITGVEETEDRNPFTDKKPVAVYIVACEYENIGYTNSLGGGLIFFLDDGPIVDSNRYMGYRYPGDIVNYPKEVPIGARCKAQYCIGVDNAGDFKLQVQKYDKNSKLQSAEFIISTKDIPIIKSTES